MALPACQSTSHSLFSGLELTPPSVFSLLVIQFTQVKNTEKELFTYLYMLMRIKIYIF